jgi:hypothetical protein
MATKTAKTRNSERKSGKAWGNGHAATAKVLSPEAVARKAEKEARRGKRVVGTGLISNITAPETSWDWFGEMMACRWPNTRRVRMMDAVQAREKGRPSAEPVLAIEPNPEAKTLRRSGR